MKKSLIIAVSAIALAGEMVATRDGVSNKENGSSGHLTAVQFAQVLHATALRAQGHACVGKTKLTAHDLLLVYACFESNNANTTKSA